MQLNDEPKFRKPEILLADDDPGDQELTCRALDRDLSPIKLRVVHDGSEAIDYLFRRGKYQNPSLSPRPDLILLDLNMPRVNGWQVLEQLRHSAELASIPVVVLTTSNHQADIARCYALGCNSFISKPAAIEPFQNMIRDLRHYWFELVVLPPMTAVTALETRLTALPAEARSQLGASAN